MATPGVLVASSDNDLVATVTRNLTRGKFTEIATSLQKHVAMRELTKKYRIVIKSGYGVQWDAMVAQTGAAQNVGLGYTDAINLIDTMTQAQADWRNTYTSWGVIGQEIDMNAEPDRIVDLVLTRRIGAMISLVELMENNFWGVPVALTDNLTPWGINTWLVKNTSQGFNGTVPSGYTTIGLNPTTYPNWCNWSDAYTTVSKDDFVRRVRKACTFTDFEPPVEGIPSTELGGDKYGYYTNYAVRGALEELLQAQNENLGMDIAKYDGHVMLNGTPVTWVPRLEADTTNPFFGVNWKWFATAILKNWWMKETHIPIYPNQHTMSGHFQDSTYQWIMYNRRPNFVLATAASYPG